MRSLQSSPVQRGDACSNDACKPGDTFLGFLSTADRDRSVSGLQQTRASPGCAPFLGLSAGLGDAWLCGVWEARQGGAKAQDASSAVAFEQTLQLLLSLTLSGQSRAQEGVWCPCMRKPGVRRP